MTVRRGALGALLVTTLAVPTLLTAPALAAAAGPVAKPTPVQVTIDGNDSPYGVVTSARRVCKAEVKVVVLEQVGTRGGGDDRKVGSDSTSLQGSTWSWSIGNPGLDDGVRVYAKVRAHDGCRTAFSLTMVVDRD